MLTTVILQLALTGMTHTPVIDVQAAHDVCSQQASSNQTVTVAYAPYHGPDPNREIHDYGMPTNNTDPYGGRTSNGSDVYGGRYGGSDPYAGKTGNNLGPYGR